MWIDLFNSAAKLRRATADEQLWLKDYLTYKDPRAHFRYGGPQNVYLLSAQHEFPAGFIPQITKAAKLEGFAVEVADRRGPPPAHDPNADLGWLRDYQKRAVDLVEAKTRGILWLPTGAGKTEVAVGLTRAFPVPWLFVVHRKDLMHNAAERFNRRNAEHGLDLDDAACFGDGVYEVGERLTVASFQTLARRLDKPGGVMVDECHTLPADSFYRTLMKFDRAYYRIGLSGTPLARGDKRSLLSVAALGPVIYRIRPDTLIKLGVIAKPHIRMVPVEHDEAKVDAKTYQGTYSKAVIRSSPRNRAIVRAAKEAAKPALIFIQQTKHGEILKNRLTKAGLNADFVWGAGTSATRQRLVKALRYGDLDVLVCSSIFQEGVDIPELRAVVNAAGGKSNIAAIQRVGRGMRRPDDTHATFEVWDFDDRGHKWLERHSRARIRAYAKEGYTVTIEDERQGRVAGT